MDGPPDGMEGANVIEDPVPSCRSRWTEILRNFTQVNKSVSFEFYNQACRFSSLFLPSDIGHLHLNVKVAMMNARLHLINFISLEYISHFRSIV